MVQCPKIIIVDDDQMITGLLTDALKGSAVDVVGVAHSYEAALPLIEAQPHCDIAFIDLRLGAALTGVELAHRAVKLGIEVVAMTGSGRLPDGLEGAALLTKPFSIEALRLLITALSARIPE
jgi:DNA-binding response OmpR family regulator